MSDTSTNAQMKTYLEEITHTTNDANFPGSTYEQQLINKGYMKAAYRYNWPQTLKRFFDPLVANVDRYSLQSDFRKMIYLFQTLMPLNPTSADHVLTSFNEYAVVLDSLEYILANLPTAATTAYTFSGSYSAGSAVVITLNSVSGISAGDEIYISDATNGSEFTKVQSVDSTLNTITVKLRLAHSNKTLYRVADGVYGQYQFQITPLSNAGDIPVLPGETHLIIPHYAAYLYYKDIEEPDRAAEHYVPEREGGGGIFNDDLDEAWLAWGKTESGEAGQFTL